jgi:ubiquinone/menaquinone biosynthesis C-methylase UbiE
MDRATEQAKYPIVYQRPDYKMGRPRMADSVRDLEALPRRGSLLDVGCGRGEMLDNAERLGFRPVKGVEIVDALIDGTRVVRGEVHALPFDDQSFDVVTMWDVIEHLVPGDDEAACREMRRVARRHILLTANNKSSLQPDGTELHVNRRPYDEWDRLFRQWFAGATVTWLRERRRQWVSEAWRIDL